MGFVDEVKFFIKAGDGGNGCVSFRRKNLFPREGRTAVTAAGAALSLLRLIPESSH